MRSLPGTEMLRPRKAAKLEKREESASQELGPKLPPLFDVVIADARVAAAYRGDERDVPNRRAGIVRAVKLMFQTDAFMGLVAYRVKKHLRARHIPVLPALAHRYAIARAQLSIADTAVVHPGVVIPHGQVVVDGEVEIQPFVTLHPWVNLAPLPGDAKGPTIGGMAVIGSGAKVFGDVTVGVGARVGSNAVVVNDVPPNTTVVGMPAAPVAD